MMTKQAKKLGEAEAAARRAIAKMIRLRFGNPAKVARAWAREWVDSIIEAPDDWPPPPDDDDDDESGDEIWVEAEHQISRDTFKLD